MKKHYSMRFFMKQAFTSLWRNGVMSVASIAVLMSCLVVLGCFALLLVNFNVNLNNIAKTNVIKVFCDTSLEEKDIKGIESKIKGLSSVEECKHITKEEALQTFKDKSPEHADAYNDFSGENNPLCDEFDVHYKIDAESDVFELESQLRNIDGVTKVNSVYEIAKTIDNLRNGIMLIFTVFLVILFVVSIFVIINTIKLAVYARKDEISVMRYVGATNRFITLPFIFEGIIIGVIASLLAFGIETYIYNYVAGSSMAALSVVEIVGYEKVFLPLLGGFVVVGMVTGIIGSVASLRKYLKS